MRQGGSKTTAMPWRAVGLKDFLKVKRCWKNQWNTGLMATRNPARKAVEGTVVLSHHLHGAIHLRWCRISSINSINESINKYSRNIKIQNQWKIYCLFVLQKKGAPRLWKSRVEFQPGCFAGSCPMIPNSFKVSRDATSRRTPWVTKNSIQCMQLIKFVTMKPRFFLGNLGFFLGPAMGHRFYCSTDSTGKRNYGCLEKHEMIMR